MTWKEFKDIVESKGVKDEDELFCIDATGWGMEQKGDLLNFVVIKNTDDSWEIYIT